MTPASRTDSETLVAHGADAIAKGSKSFGLASLLFNRNMRGHVHMLYAWCRYCDDIIDGQTLGGDAPIAVARSDEQRHKLQQLRHLTKQAMSGQPTGNPAFDGFGEVSLRYEIPEIYAMDLLDGFERDVSGEQYPTISDTLHYCYGVAGVVGVMMAIIMGVDKRDDETLDRACDLGLAFQLTNICRDVIDDAKGGRIYLPLDWLANEGVEANCEAVIDPKNRAAVAKVADRVLREAELYYTSASEGVRRLGLRSAAAILAARNVYRSIGILVAERGAKAWDDRVVISGGRKVILAAAGIFESLPQKAFKSSRAYTPRRALWNRPVRGF
jgi:phytoene synthase